MNRCPQCGVNLALTGRVHRCRPRTVTDIAPAVTDTPAEKQRRYRERHAERIRAADRDRKRRARKESA